MVEWKQSETKLQMDDKLGCRSGPKFYLNLVMLSDLICNKAFSQKVSLDNFIDLAMHAGIHEKSWSSLHTYIYHKTSTTCVVLLAKTGWKCDFVTKGLTAWSTRNFQKSFLDICKQIIER